MTASVYDDRACFLGEGPLWHPMRKQLFWFDIIGKTLLSRDGDTPLNWTFDQMVSAAGWIDEARLLIATETGLIDFNIDTGAQTSVADIEADNHETRSNDGRADPYGGFWIGTMGKKAEDDAGAIYRYYRGEVRKLYDVVSIPNAICFSPDGSTGYFADTTAKIVKKVALDPDTGWPAGEPEIFLDLASEGLKPDGAVIAEDGTMWLAQWGAGRVAAYGPDGKFKREVKIDAPHSSCPAFGGDDRTTLFCTTAQQGMSDEALAEKPQAGKLFSASDVAKGQAEHQVVL